MKEINKNNLYIRILEFGEKNPKGFSYNDLKNVIKPNGWENEIIIRYLYNAVKNNRPSNKVLNETIFLESFIDKNSHWTINFNQIESDNLSEEEKINNALVNKNFILKYDAYFNYIDYLELQKAIENSREANVHAKGAKNLALWAIWLAIIVGTIQIVIGITQIIIDIYHK